MHISSTWCLTYLEDSPRDDPPPLPRLAALHGVSLARPSLPIAEQAHLHTSITATDSDAGHCTLVFQQTDAPLSCTSDGGSTDERFSGCGTTIRRLGQQQATKV